MKRTFRILATFLSIALLICALPQSVLAQIGDLLNGQDTEATETVSPDVYVLGEVIDNRTETSKTFRMSDGSFIAADYGQVIHYAGEDGAWTDYDNTLTFSEASSDSEDMAGYGNTGSNLRIKLANNSNSNNLVKLTMGDYKISLHLVGANKSKALEVYPAMEDPEGNDIDSAATLHKFSAGAIYEDILPDVDLEYIISGGSVKENIIIKDTADSYTYTFELKLHGLIPEVDDEGNILLKDATTNVTQLVIPAGYMFDANGAYSDAVTYSIAHKTGKKYTLTVTADADWINADDRAFPVTVDPTVEAFESITNTWDNYISENDPDANHITSWKMVVGYNGTKEWHALIKAASLPAIPDSAVIVSASMQIYQTASSSASVNIAAVPIASSWNTNTVTWNTKPTYGTDILDYVTVSPATEDTVVSFDVTRLAQTWYQSTSNNLGIALVPLAGNGTGHAYFNSSDSGSYTEYRPKLFVAYRDTKGLESTWTYASHSAGVAGAGYVNGFNGNLVFVHSDMATEGSILPVAVSHVYNSYLAGKNFTATEGDLNAPITTSNSLTMGKGWKLSIQETLVPYELDNSTKEWYVYNDADGTELYFYRVASDSNQYVSEDGYGLIVTVNANGTITLADEYGNKKLFDADGRLSTITDVYGNQKRILYSNGAPSSVTYLPVDETSSITQLVFQYNENGALTKITNAYNTADYVEYEYSAMYTGSYSNTNSGYLRKITYSLGGYTLFSYNSDGTMASVINGDTSYKTSYSYTSHLGKKRVAAVTESAAGSTGQKVSFAYDNKKFTVRTAGLDDVHGNADDIVTTTLFDHFGKGTCTYSNKVNNSTIYGTAYTAYTPFEIGSKANNKVMADVVAGNTNENLIKDGNAGANEWTKTASGTGYSAEHSSADSFVGSYSYRLRSTVEGNGYAECSQTVSIATAGTYTFSAYVYTKNIVSTSGGGAYLVLDDAESEKLTGSANENIQLGYRRISVTKTFASPGNYTVKLRLRDAVGQAYFDCIQLEESNTPSAYNFLENSSFRGSSKWAGDLSIVETEATRGHVGVLAGTPNSKKQASQSIRLGADQTTTFVLSGWARANSADLDSSEGSNKENRKFGLMATITYSNGDTEEHYVPFNPDITGWQYAAMAIVPHPESEMSIISSVEIAVAYDYNVNLMYFDDLCFTIEPMQSFLYDENGNLHASTDKTGQKSSLTYDENNVDLINYTTATGETYDFTYAETVDGVNTHDVESTLRTVGDITHNLTYNYDKYGNVIKTTLTAAGTEEKIQTRAVYSDKGNYLSKVIDSLENETWYTYDSVTKLLKYIEDANNSRTGHLYDTRQRMTHVYIDADKDGTRDGNEAAVEYLYSQNRVSGIKTATTTYTMQFDNFGNVVAIYAGDYQIAEYVYADGNGKLLRLNYGNDFYEEYTYDHLDRLVIVTYNGNASTGYELFYDSNGRLYQTVDREIGLTYVYEYDSLGFLIRACQKNTSNGTRLLEVENAYDEYGKIIGSIYSIGNESQSYGISYRDGSGLISDYSTPGNSFSYSYDKFERLSQKDGEVYWIDYTYVAGSQRIATYTISQQNNTSTTYSYTYDALGNITTIKQDGSLICAYVYDALGRLTSETNHENQTITNYTYDNTGNILNKVVTSLSGIFLGSVPYGYASTTWGDLLTTYNGISISYDAIGNPTKWRNAANMEWHQRSLISMTANGANVTYTYNADGIRTHKTHGTTGHAYVLDGSTILRETIVTAGNTTHTMYYYYDESGISGLEYNRTKYTYIKNLQGDVIGIINGSGVTVVEYKYDAWGSVLSVTGSMASTLGAINPFRYRGYYYDTESGWYYLNSRYYDPQVGRFLNADGIIGANGGIMGYNLFAYCNNNPVKYADPSGQALCESVIQDIQFNAHVNAQVQEYDPRNYSGCKAEFVKAVEGLLNDIGPVAVRQSYLDYYYELIEQGYGASYGTFSLKLGFNICFITISISLTIDREGNFAIQPALGISTSFSIDASLGYSMAVAKNYQSLNGWSISSEEKYGPRKGPSASVGSSWGSSSAAFSYSLSWTWMSDPKERFLPYSNISQYFGEKETYSLSFTWTI